MSLDQEVMDYLQDHTRRIHQLEKALLLNVDITKSQQKMNDNIIKALQNITEMLKKND